MLPQIAKALSSGYTTKQIFEFLLKKFPQHADKIKKALTAGFTVDQVVKFLGGGREELNQSEGTTEFERTRESDIQQRESLNKQALALGGAATSTLAAPIIGQALKRALPTILGDMIPGGTDQSQQQKTPQIPSQQPPIANIAPIIPGQPIVPQPEEMSTIPEIAAVQQKQSDIHELWSMAQRGKTAGNPFLKTASKLIKNGTIPDEQTFSNFRNWWKATGGQSRGNDTVEFEKFRIQTKGMQQPEPTPIIQEIPKAVEEQKQEPKKAKEVLLPSGDIGTIESTSKGIAHLDVDGKKKRYREQDLIESPLPENDMASIYEELINTIPENERSSVINVAGYDPNHNELLFMPHDGALYVYKDIPPDFAEKLKGAMFQAKTTGENLYGSWAEGESSRFAGLHLLIKELQKLYGGKGKEYVRKYAKVYDFLALPKAALKEKQRKEREEERIRQGKKPRKPRPS